MPLEIKGLRQSATSAAAHIERLRSAYAKLNEIAPAHASDVESLVAQVTGIADDITFAATVLGNSSSEPAPAPDPPAVGEVAKPFQSQ